MVPGIFPSQLGSLSMGRTYIETRLLPDLYWLVTFLSWFQASYHFLPNGKSAWDLVHGPNLI